MVWGKTSITDREATIGALHDGMIRHAIDAYGEEGLVNELTLSDYLASSENNLAELAGLSQNVRAELGEELSERVEDGLQVAIDVHSLDGVIPEFFSRPQYDFNINKLMRILDDNRQGVSGNGRDPVINLGGFLSSMSKVDRELYKNMMDDSEGVYDRREVVNVIGQNVMNEYLRFRKMYTGEMLEVFRQATFAIKEAKRVAENGNVLDATNIIDVMSPEEMLVFFEIERGHSEIENPEEKVKEIAKGVLERSKQDVVSLMNAWNGHLHNRAGLYSVVHNLCKKAEEVGENPEEWILDFSEASVLPFAKFPGDEGGPLVYENHQARVRYFDSLVKLLKGGHKAYEVWQYGNKVKSLMRKGDMNVDSASNVAISFVRSVTSHESAESVAMSSEDNFDLALKNRNEWLFNEISESYQWAVFKNAYRSILRLNGLLSEREGATALSLGQINSHFKELVSKSLVEIMNEKFGSGNIDEAYASFRSKDTFHQYFNISLDDVGENLICKEMFGVSIDVDYYEREKKEKNPDATETTDEGIRNLVNSILFSKVISSFPDVFAENFYSNRGRVHTDGVNPMTLEKALGVQNITPGESVYSEEISAAVERQMGDILESYGLRES